MVSKKSLQLEIDRKKKCFLFQSRSAVDDYLGIWGAKYYFCFQPVIFMAYWQTVNELKKGLWQRLFHISTGAPKESLKLLIEGTWGLNPIIGFVWSINGSFDGGNQKANSIAPIRFHFMSRDFWHDKNPIQIFQNVTKQIEIIAKGDDFVCQMWVNRVSE